MEPERPAHVGHRPAAYRAGRDERARLLRGHLNPAAFGLVLSSPRQRARRTAELAGFVGEYAPQIEPDLAEWAYGDYEGLTRDQIHAEHRPGLADLDRANPGRRVAGGRSQPRMEPADRPGSRAPAWTRSLLFGHGHALRALTMVWLGLELVAGAQFELHTGTICILSEERDGRTLELWNAPVDRPSGP